MVGRVAARSFTYVFVIFPLRFQNMFCTYCIQIIKKSMIIIFITKAFIQTQIVIVGNLGLRVEKE